MQESIFSLLRLLPERSFSQTGLPRAKAQFLFKNAPLVFLLFDGPLGFLACLLLLRAQMTKCFFQLDNGQFGVLLLLLGLLHFLAEGFQFAGPFLSLGPRQIFFKRIDGTLQLTAGGLDTANLIGTVYQRILQGVQCKLQIVDEVPGVFQFLFISKKV